MSYQQRPYTTQHTMAGPLGHVSGGVRTQIHDLSRSGNYYCTPEMDRELRHIKHGVEHVNLDHDFLRESKDWGQKWCPQKQRNELEGVANVMCHTTGAINNIKGQMTTRAINSEVDNQVRQKHHTTMQSLNQCEGHLEPYTNHSVDRIKQYCDHVGVTDRYSGYKHNLNRGTREPNKLGYQWLADDRRDASFSFDKNRPSNQVLGVSDPRNTRSARNPNIFSRRMSPPPYVNNCMQKAVSPKSMSIQEQCGISTKYPAIPEYTLRFKKPNPDPITLPFNINPTPNSDIHGRPHATIMWEPSHSEYQWRYEWPDSAKIDKLPWVKEF